MSTVVFVSQDTPEKHLISKIIYRFHPSSDLKNQILAEIQRHVKDIPLSDSDVIMDLDIQLTIKTYDTQNS